MVYTKKTVFYLLKGDYRALGFEFRIQGLGSRA